MNKWLTRVGVVVVVVVMALGIIGSAAAQGPDTPPNGPTTGPRLPRLQERVGKNQLGGQLLDAVAEATGLTREDVVPQLQAGKTFAQILDENGIDQQVVIDAVVAVVTEEVNTALAEGKITEERAQQILERVPARLESAMNASVQRGERREQIQDRFEMTMLAVLAEMAGMEPGELLREELAPPTLAEIAESRGLDPNAIIAETEARITEQVNQALAEGTITEETAAQILDGLHDRLVERFNNPVRLPRPQNRPGGQGQTGQGV